ncbi:MAG: alkaline phosphatase family protein [Candidatus Edwardsbacteria bacterium]|jgi:hypothetical protein|nr:alkaline phosphatase family protein [Candidatus Edwardsbacteria bacterium]
MLKPDYRGGGIVNLMASIAGRFGHRTGYPQLRALPAAALRQHRTVVLVVLDGLGYRYLTTRGAGSFLHRRLEARLTSGFPTTTSSCVATFATGVAAERHGITGWFTHLPELGAVSTILFARPRYGGPAFSDAGVGFKDIMLAGPIFDRLRAESVVITQRSIAYGDFSRANSGNATVRCYSDLGGFIRRIASAVRSARGTAFISAYWPGFDHRCHHHGTGHSAVTRHFRDLDRSIERLSARLSGSGAVMLITADHGLADTPRDRLVDLADHPRMAECLTLPLCGEPRLAYCYVRPDKAGQFTQYVRTRLRHCCDLRTRGQLVRRGFYGTGKADPRFAGRIGDFILVMKPGWCIKDFLPNEQRFFLKANHGGVTADEMYVPLVVVAP